jgi:hypothetical protein
MRNTIDEPDRWLIASKGAYGSIRGHWVHCAGEHSLLALRLRKGWIEFVAPEALADRVARLAAEGARTVLVVFDEVDDGAARQLNAIAGAHADAIELRVLEWLASPLAAVSAMNDPDGQLREVLQADAAANAMGGASGRMAAAPWWPELKAALLAWEQQARSHQGDDFADLYPAYAEQRIPWSRLGGEIEAPVDAERTPDVSANDWSWTEVQIRSLAADTQKAQPYGAMRRKPPGADAKRWRLSRYPIVGEKAVYLMFEAESGSVGSYAGCRIQVLAKGHTYELGVVNDDGVAEVRLDGTVDISQALVRIGNRRPQGH